MKCIQIVEAEQYIHPNPLKMEGITWRACVSTHCHVNEDIGKELRLEDGDYLVKEPDGNLRKIKADIFLKIFKQIPNDCNLDDIYKE